MALRIVYESVARQTRQQQTLLSASVLSGTNGALQRKLIQKANSWAFKDVIPALQAEYVRNPEHPRSYKRTGNLGRGWNANTGLSHGDIAIVFTNTAREQITLSGHAKATGRTYWQYVQGPKQNEEVVNIERWYTVEQILSGGIHGRDFREKMQDAFDELAR